ncbi:MAG TPA: DUF1559 domain-containing protein, partial [Gemmataceae bacterium]|nr:DUF1559 domain-containing protein [Gemmataceae bacterium]
RSFGGGEFPESRDGVFFTGSRTRLTDIKDGTSNTFLLGERYHRDAEFDRLTLKYDDTSYPLSNWGSWASAAYSTASQAEVMLSSLAPINYLVPPGSEAAALNDDWTWEDNRLNAFGSGHPGGANLAFADGSVRFVRDSIALRDLRALSTRAGQEVVDLP